MSPQILNILAGHSGASFEQAEARLSAGFPLNRHIAHFYDSAEDLLQLLVPYFAEGLIDGEFCLWGVADPLTVQSATAALDKAFDGRIAPYIKNEQLEIFNVQKLYGTGPFDAMAVKDAFLKKVFATLKTGWKRFRCDGMASGLAPANWINYQTYEYEVTRSMQAPITALCSYDLTKLSAEQMIQVVTTHQSSIVKQNNRWNVLESAEHLILLEDQRQNARGRFNS